MSATSVYNHRNMQPSAQTAGAATHSHPQGRFLDLLDNLRQEHESLHLETAALRQQRDECEAKITTQVNELNIIRQSLYDLEAQHSKIRSQYEDELQRLRAELHQNSKPSGPIHSPLDTHSHTTGTTMMSQSSSGYYRERDWDRDREREQRDRTMDRDRERERERERDMRERDRERERLVDSRDPKRLKRQDYSPHLQPPHLPPHPAPSGHLGPKTLPPIPAIHSHPMDHGSGGGNFAGSPTNSGIGLSHPPPPSALSVPTPSPSHGSASPAAPPVILSDLDVATLPPDLKREGKEWFCVFNPAITGSSGEVGKKKKSLDIDLLWTFTHQTVVCCVQFSNDGQWLATGCNKTAQIYDITTGKKICVLADDNVNPKGDLYIRSVRFSPDGKYLATGAEDKQIRIWDIAKRRIIVNFSGHTQEIYSLDFSPDGRYIISGSGDKTAKIWTLSPFIEYSRRDTTLPSNPPPPSPLDPQYCRTLSVTESPRLSPSTPGGSNGQNQDSLNGDGGVTSVAISPDGRLVAAGSLDYLVRIWEISTGLLVDRLRGHTNSVYSVVFTPDGRGVVSGSLDRTMKYWDISGLYNERKLRELKPSDPSVGRCTMNFTGHKDYVLSVAVSHDGQWIVSGSKDRGVQFWDSKTAIPQCMLQGHKNSVISINLNPSYPYLATGSGDTLARVWTYKMSDR